MSETLTLRSRFRDYSVRFVEDFTRPLTSYAQSSFFLVDQKILKLYAKEIENLLPQERTLTVESQESNKTLEFCQLLIECLIEKRIRKNDTLVAIGGGVLQDLTAFIASVLYRGVRWSFFPTTLAAQADNCVGGKTSINFRGYKNLLGTFYPPEEIFIATRFLQTLPLDEIKSGIGEMLHFYLIDGSSCAVRLMNQYEALIEHPRDFAPYIRASLEIKKKTVEKDEFDENERRIFNYGHTFGHAIESVSHFSIPHGQAVTMGMDLANYVSLSLGYLDEENFLQMRRTLSKNMPDFTLLPEGLDDYLRAISKDKKNLGENLGCILTHGLGRMFFTQIPMNDTFKEILSRYFGVTHDLLLRSQR